MLTVSGRALCDRWAMPELPEVETVRRGLEPVLAGARLAKVEARRADLRFPFPDGFVQRLTGARIASLGRRSKYLLAPTDRGDTLVMHMGMSGRFEIEGQKRPGHFQQAVSPHPKHAHVLFETEAGARVTFFDPRRFGYMDLIATDALAAHPWFAGLGPEPLSDDLDTAYLRQALAGRRQNIKACLLDQRIVAGLGNIYVCEALFEAGISPARAGGRVSAAKLETLIVAIRAVLNDAIAAGGSTLRDFAGADGALGYFQHNFKVYGREGEPCARKGCCGVVRRIVQAGRSTFYCPACQR
jgi:formamidopyrimidine-DNA glycosylase